jgi:hypothetical protein
MDPVNVRTDSDGANGRRLVAARVVGNNVAIHGAGAPDCLRVNYCNDAQVEGNYFDPAAGAEAVSVTANAVRTVVASSNVYV